MKLNFLIKSSKEMKQQKSFAPQLQFSKATVNFSQFFSILIVGCLLFTAACKTDPDCPGDPECVTCPGDPSCPPETVDASTINFNCSDLNGDFTFENNPDAAVDYLIDCTLNIDFDVVVEPGTVIAFAEGASIAIKDDGSLKALGTAAEPIVFQGEEDAKGYWKGIGIQSNSLKNQFDHVRVYNAGSNYVFCCNNYASIAVENTGRLDISNSILDGGAGHGLVVEFDGVLGNYANNTISNHDLNPMYISPQQLSALDGVTSTYTDNIDNTIGVYTGTVTIAQTWPKNTIPYKLIGAYVTYIETNITVAAGADFTFEEDGGIGVRTDGSFKAVGTGVEPIKFRGEEPAKGYWKGIHYDSNSLNNQLAFVEVSDAGSGYIFCCGEAASVRVESGRLSLTNSTLSNGAGYGLIVLNDQVLENFANNSINTHDEAPIYMTPEQLGKIDGASTFTGNLDNYIRAWDTTVDISQTWGKTTIPYKFDGGNTYIEADVQVAAGAELVFQEDAGFGVRNGGSFKAVGTTTETITFRGDEPINGYWNGIHYNTNSTDNLLSFISISDGGNSYVFCCSAQANVNVENEASATVTNSSISNSGGWGIETQSGGNVTQSGNTFTNNTLGDVGP